MHVGRALLVAVAVVLAVAAPAGAAGWLPSTVLAQAGAEPALAVAADGTAVAVWKSGGVLHAARHTPGVAGFAAVAPFGAAGADAPGVGIDVFGNATAVWLEGTVVRVATLPEGVNSFGTADALSTNGAGPALDVAPDGTAVVAWSEPGAVSGRHVAAAYRAPGGDDFILEGPLSTDLPLVSATGGSDAAVDAAVSGRAIVGWATSLSADSAVRQPGTPFLAGPSSAGVLVTELTAAIDGLGGTTLAWRDGAAIKHEGSTGSGQFSSAGAHPVLAAGDVGTTVAAWLEGGKVFTATRPPSGGVFAAGAGLADAAGSPSLAVGPRGDVLAGWSGSDGGARAARRAAGASDFEAARNLGSGAAPALGADAEGSAAAAWSDGTAVGAAVLDAGAPVLGPVTAPATVTAGVPAAFAASATDRWSAVGFGWAFGDGATAAGGAVSHAFGATGTPVVTVTASDAAGNAVSVDRSVTVSAPVVQPPPPPPPPETVATPRVAVPVTPSWRVRGKVIRLLRLKLAGLPSGATAELRCKGKRCPLRRTRTFKARAGRINLVKPLDRDQLRFKAGQRVELWVLAPNRIGLVVRWALKRGSKPQPQTLCVPLGAAKARATC